MLMLEVGTRQLQLFFQETAHGMRYILQVNTINSSLQARISVNPFKSDVVII